MIIAPIRPTNTPIQRRNPTFSLRTKKPSIVMNNGEISKIAVAELIGRCLSEVKNDMVAPNRKAERINCKPMCFVRSKLVMNGERTTKAITVCEVHRAQTTCNGW